MGSHGTVEKEIVRRNTDGVSKVACITPGVNTVGVKACVCGAVVLFGVLIPARVVNCGFVSIPDATSADAGDADVADAMPVAVSSVCCCRSR